MNEISNEVRRAAGIVGKRVAAPGSEPVEESSDLLRRNDILVDIGDVAAALWRRRWLLAMAATVCGVATFAAVSTIPPQYVARAQVMLETRREQAVSDADVMSEIELSNAALLSEIEVIRSNNLLRKVVADLDLASTPEFSTRLTTQPAWRSLLDGAAGALGLSSGEAVAATPSERRLLEEMRARLDVRREGISYVINVQFRAEDPERAAMVSNAIVETYIAEQIAWRSGAADRATEWMDDRVATLAAQMREAETALEDFKARSLQTEGGGVDALNDQVANVSYLLAAARADLAERDARLTRFDSVLREDTVEAAAAVADGDAVSALRERLSEAKSALSSVESVYGRNHELRVAAAREVSSLRDLLDAEVRLHREALSNEREVARIRVASLSDSLRALEQRAQELSSATITMRQLEREAAALREVYTDTLTRLKQLRSERSILRADARIVSGAAPPGAPASPRVKLLTALGAAGGLSLAACLVFLFEIIGGVIATARDARRRIAAPLLAALPAEPRRSARQMLASLESGGATALADRLRLLCTMLDLGRASDRPRVIAVLGARRGAGRTSVALGLAHAAARLGRRPILVEADIRNPVLAALADERDAGDLAQALRGGHAPQASRIASGGFAMLAARDPDPDLADDLSSSALPALLDRLGATYDTIILDTPPVLSAFEALAVGRSADSAILVLRAGVTTEDEARRTLRMLHSAGAHVVGTVLQGPPGRIERLRAGVARWLAPRVAAASLAAVLTQGLAAPAEAQEAYRLSHGDAVAVWVVPSEPPVESVVDSDGMLVLPGLGRTRAAGLGPTALEAAVAELAERRGRFVDPAVTVAVLSHAPVTVLGDVRTPGAVPFSRYMDVATAVGLAGGVGLTGIAIEARLDRRLSAETALREAVADEIRARVRLARVEAQLRGDRDLTIGDGLAARADAAGVDLAAIEQVERTMLRDRLDASAALVANIDAAIAETERETALLDERIDTQAELAAIAGDELARAENLIERGLRPANTVLETRRRATEARDDLLAVRTARSQAQLRRTTLAKERLSHLADVRDAAMQLRYAALVDLGEARRREKAARVELAAIGALPSASADYAASLRRRTADGYETLPAGPGTELRPGDVVTILSVESTGRIGIAAID